MPKPNHRSDHGTKNVPRSPSLPSTRSSHQAISPSRVMAPDPASLIERRRPSPWRHLRLLPIGICIVVVAEVLLPEQVRPFNLAGGAVASFQRHLDENEVAKQLTYVEQEQIARLLAERQTEYSAWIGRCDIVAVFEPQAGAICHQAAEAFYDEAIDDVMRLRDQYLTLRRQGQ